MNLLKRYPSVLLVTAAFLSFTACRKSSAPEMGRTPLTQEQLQQPQGGTIALGQTKYFKGSIGSALNLQMKLVREGDKFSGNYFYQKVGTKIDLRGTIDDKGNVVLDEFDAAGKQTGSFKGTWKPDENGLIEISGNWIKPNSDKQTAFSLHEEPIEFSSAVEIVAKQIKESNKKLKYEIDADYPQLTGSTDPNHEKFNQLVRSMVNRKVNEFRKDMQPSKEEREEGLSELTESSTGSDLGIGYTVALAKDDLISIVFGVGSYYRGAAHPNSHTEVVNFDLKNGKALKLADLFKPGAKYLQAVSSYCIKELEKKSAAEGTDGMLDDPWIERGAAPDVENFKSWTIEKKGLNITFDSYQVAPYAAGPQEVMIPYTALKEIINVDGPVGQFVK